MSAIEVRFLGGPMHSKTLSLPEGIRQYRAPLLAQPVYLKPEELNRLVSIQDFVYDISWYPFPKLDSPMAKYVGHAQDFKVVESEVRIPHGPGCRDSIEARTRAVETLYRLHSPVALVDWSIAINTSTWTWEGRVYFLKERTCSITSSPQSRPSSSSPSCSTGPVEMPAVTAGKPSEKNSIRC